MSTIYRKTAKGQAEIETRAHRLPPRLRGALIMVDGQRGSEELRKLIPADPDGTLQQLLADGFIEVFAVLAERPPAPPPPSAPAVPPAPARRPVPEPSSLEGLRRDAVRYLNDRLGPAGEGISIKIEKARTMAELQPLLAQAATLLRNFGGAAAADPFVARFVQGVA